MTKIYRPKDEPEAVVIDFEDGTMPAYIPKCPEYALKAIKRLAQKSGQSDGDTVYNLHGKTLARGKAVLYSIITNKKE